VTPGSDQPPTQRPERASERVLSRVLVHTGDGKGKTSAATGIVMRAAARGWRVSVVQFVKDGRWKTGEEKSASELGADWWSIGDGFTGESTDMDRTEAIAREAGWIDVRDVAETIRDRPPHVNLVATGREAPVAPCVVADTAMEMASVKHAFDPGVGAMRGIEY
jgi:cob(I)alamin adenosyltransferase